MLRLSLSCISLWLLTAPALAQSLCDELWGERNAIYFDAGYCFKTARGIKAFGNNVDCKYDDIADVPLTARNRSDIAQIQAQERQRNCPR